MQSIDICFRDIHSQQGEEAIHGLDAYSAPASALAWPDTDAMIECKREREPLVVRLDGAVAGRVYLEAELYPLAEIVNLEILPWCRGRGLGSATVEALIRRANELGYPAIHLQTEVTNTVAQGLYRKHGFLPAAIGSEMLRMVHFSNFGLLSAFQYDHPLSVFDIRGSGTEEPRPHLLTWRDPVTEDTLSLGITGGSCQGDSLGYGPGLERVVVREGDRELQFELTCAGDTAESELSLILTVTNRGAEPETGVVRLMLNHGFTTASGSAEVARYTSEPGATMQLQFRVERTAAFNPDFWQHSSYRSVPFGIELFADGSTFWLAKQLILTTA